MYFRVLSKRNLSLKRWLVFFTLKIWDDWFTRKKLYGRGEESWEWMRRRGEEGKGGEEEEEVV